MIRHLLFVIPCCLLAASCTPVESPVNLGTTGTPVVSRVDRSLSPSNFLWRAEDGTEHSLAEYRGRVVVVNFFATWCGPCRDEIPGIIRVLRDSAAKGVEVIGVSVDNSSSDGTSLRSFVARFVADFSITYPVVIATSDLAEAYGGIAYIPQTFIVKPDGTLSEHIGGGVSEGSLRAAIGRARQ